MKYEFEADWRMFRDADQVLTSIADRWDRGTLIHILYSPDQDYDSVAAGQPDRARLISARRSNRHERKAYQASLKAP